MAVPVTVPSDPGSTAVNDWLDDDGQPIYGNDNKSGEDAES